MYYDQYQDISKKTIYGLTDATNIVREMATHGTGGKMSVYGLRHAVIGGKFGEWRLRSEPEMNESIRVSQYFDEDAAILSDEAGEHKGNEKWAGTGHFLLPDFCKLTEFLNDMSSSEMTNATSKQYEA